MCDGTEWTVHNNTPMLLSSYQQLCEDECDEDPDTHSIANSCLNYQPANIQMGEINTVERNTKCEINLITSVKTKRSKHTEHSEESKDILKTREECEYGLTVNDTVSRDHKRHPSKYPQHAHIHVCNPI